MRCVKSILHGAWWITSSKIVSYGVIIIREWESQAHKFHQHLSAGSGSRGGFWIDQVYVIYIISYPVPQAYREGTK